MLGLAVNNVINKASAPAVRLRLLDEVDESGARFMTLRFKMYVELKRHDEARAILRHPDMSSLLTSLKGDKDQGFKVHYGASIGRRALALGECQLALPWLELAQSTQPDPQRAKLIKTARVQQKPNGLCE